MTSSAHIHKVVEACLPHVNFSTRHCKINQALHNMFNRALSVRVEVIDETKTIHVLGESMISMPRIGLSSRNCELNDRD